jgi:hypothetical protein
LTAPEALPPGFGFVTLTANIPAEASDPVAVSFVAEIKVVVNAAPPNITCAPFTNWLPFTVSVKAPVENVAGAALETLGVSFQSVTALDALTLES